MENTRRRPEATESYNSMLDAGDVWGDAQGLRVIDENDVGYIEAVTVEFDLISFLDRPLSTGTTCIIRRNRDCLPAPNGHGRHFWRATLSAIYIPPRDHLKAVTSWTGIPLKMLQLKMS